MVHAIPAPIMSKDLPSAPALPNRPGGLEAPALSQATAWLFGDHCWPESRTDSLASVVDILTIAILSVIAGGNGWEDMEVYEQRSLVINVSGFTQWHSKCGYLSASIERIDAKQFAQCFEQWIKQLVEDLGIGVIAIDGKTVKGSYERDCDRRHCIWSVLGQPNSVWC